MANGIVEALPAGKLVLEKPTMMDLLSLALHKEAAIDVIERLAALQREQMDLEAKVEFDDALGGIQAEIKRIAPDLDNPQTRSKYASYAAIDRKIRPLFPRGFSLSFTTEDCPKEDHIRVVGFASYHGHTRKYQVDMPCDGKGAKGNDVMSKTHAAGAAMSYGMRYLVKGIFNIAVGEEDSDGNLTNGDLAEQIEWLQNASSADELKKLFQVAYEKFETNPAALRALVAAKNEKRKEF